MILFPFGSSGGSSPVDALYIGGRYIPNAENCVELDCRTGGGTANWGGFRKSTAPSSLYQVPASYNLQIMAARSWVYTGSTGPVTILYGDDGVAADSTSAPTNPVYYGNNSSYYGTLILPSSVPSQTVFIDTVLTFLVPSGKYPAVRCSAGIDIGVRVWGKLVAV